MGVFVTVTENSLRCARRQLRKVRFLPNEEVHTNTRRRALRRGKMTEPVPSYYTMLAGRA